MELDHVTAIVADADAAAEALSRLLGVAPIASLALPGMNIRSFRVGSAEMHVNAPTGPGPVADHFRAHGMSYHHVAFRVDDLDRALAELAQRGFAAAGAPIETAPGLREVFLDPKTAGGMLIQLVERRQASDTAYELDRSAVADLAEQGRERPA